MSKGDLRKQCSELVTDGKKGLALKYGAGNKRTSRPKMDQTHRHLGIRVLFGQGVVVADSPGPDSLLFA